MFTTDFTVLYNEIGPDRLATASAVLTYLQDTAIAHSEAVGCTLDYLIENHRAWLLLWWRVKAERYPRYGEKLYSTTWASDIHGVCGKREFTIRDVRGGVCVRADSMWVMYNSEKGRLCSVGKEIAAAYSPEDVCVFGEEYTDIEMPTDLAPRAAHKVLKRDIDTNLHVNNVRYLDYALEEYPDFRSPREFYVRYKSSATKGDTILPFVSEKDGSLFCSLRGEKGVFSDIKLVF